VRRSRLSHSGTVAEPEREALDPNQACA
jgi:hypothetical protein